MLEFIHNGVWYIHCATFTDADREWKRLYDSETPCVIWMQGTDTPWAAFPMERLLAKGL